MKVLFPCMTFYPAQIGGPNNTLLWHTTYLKDKGWQPIIITSNHGIGKDNKVIPGKWNEDIFGNVIYFHEIFLGLPLNIIYCTLKHLKESEIIHFNGIYNRVSLFLIFIVAALGKPIVLSPRGELFGAAIKRKSVGKRIILSFLSLIKKQILFHATSPEEENTIKSFFGQVKVVIQPNFISADYSDKKNEIKKDFLFLGRINPIKNIHLLIEAAAKSKEFLSSNSIIKIAGKARLDFEIEYKKELERLIIDLDMREKVVFTGHVENDDKDKLIKGAYFLVLLSKSENFGNVVLEALICGTPVIASTGTPWQTLNTYSAGYWIDNNIETILKTIDLALGLGKEGYETLSRNSNKLVRSLYDVNSIENKWLEIYQGLKRGAVFV